MSETLRDVRRTFSASDAGLPSTDVLQRSLHRFASTGSIGNFTELKHVCHGITVPLSSNQCSLLDRPSLFNSLLDLVERHGSQAKQYRRCYQGLLTGYFGFEKQAASDEGQASWKRLRTYLGERLDPIVQTAARRGLSVDWLKALSAHRNLLTEDPCGRYAAQLQQGDPGELRLLCAALGIASTSWVWNEALMAYVRAVCAGDDSHFQHDLSGVLNLVNGRVEMKLAQLLATRAAAMAVARYARCIDRPEHNDLRDTSLRCIGNPWLNRVAWDAHVQHEPARQMVEGWIKRRLIRDFFELMAHDGGADLRRLNYWLKREPEISDMWFVLGSDARDNRSATFEELRTRMSGRRRSLDDPNGQNNAFVMRIGPLVVIEFGVKGNACYVFAASDFKADLDRPLMRLHVLKQRENATRLSHNGSWEPRFDYELRRLLQSVPRHKAELSTNAVPAVSSGVIGELAPTTGLQTNSAAVPHAKCIPPALVEAASIPPLSFTLVPAGVISPLTLPVLVKAASLPPLSFASVPAGVISPLTIRRTTTTLDEGQLSNIMASCDRYGVCWEDNRPKKGAFWVLMQDRIEHPGFATLLDHTGFAYAPGKGFWIKDST